MNKIKITRTKQSKINDVDFDNLSFGSVFSDHMLVCDFHEGKWSTPEVVPFQALNLMPSSKIFHYGQSIFEGMKAYKDRNNSTWLFRPEENFKRLNLSAKRLAIPLIPKDHFFNGLKALLQVDEQWIPTKEGSSLYIRPIVFATGEGFHASPADKYKFIISTAPSGAYFAGEVKVLIEQKFSRSANGGVGFAKAGGNYAGQFYPTQLAIEKGYQQVIWTDDHQHEYIEEAGSMNIFVRINDTLITGPTSDRILDGVTRKSVIDIAKSEGINIEVRKFTVTEVVEASKNGTLKEMFGAGTAAVISPISAYGFQGVDYRLPNVNNPFAEIIKDRIISIQTNKAEDPFGWRFKV
jgi:branched-chain amino acid aminotransferase